MLRAKSRSFFKIPPFAEAAPKVRALLVSSVLALTLSLSGWDCQQICCFHFHSCRVTRLQELTKAKCMPVESFNVEGKKD